MTSDITQQQLLSNKIKWKEGAAQVDYLTKLTFSRAGCFLGSISRYTMIIIHKVYSWFTKNVSFIKIKEKTLKGGLLLISPTSAKPETDPAIQSKRHWVTAHSEAWRTKTDCKNKEENERLSITYSMDAVACVQTSPPPSGKNRERGRFFSRFFPEGGGDVHRLWMQAMDAVNMKISAQSTSVKMVIRTHRVRLPSNRAKQQGSISVALSVLPEKGRLVTWVFDRVRSAGSFS